MWTFHVSLRGPVIKFDNQWDIWNFMRTNEATKEEKAPKGLFLIFFVFWPTPKHTKWGLRPQTPFSLRKSKNL